MTSAQTFQVSYPPYFYEAALFKEVNDDASKATIANGLVTFNLLKKQSEIWGQLHSRYDKDRYRRQMKNLFAQNPLIPTFQNPLIAKFGGNPLE